MRSAVFATLLSSFLFVGCLHKPVKPGAPTPPVVVNCDMIAVEGREPYLNCKWSDGKPIGKFYTKDLWKHEDKFMCTTATSYAEGWKYDQSLRRWIKNYCK